ncbi:YCF48-related protein [Rhodoferax sp.]|uniref:WD40/YVTN/BNR-like repeat-containing protein n=1 Tax=Rhodoferax sp. TaxID=50421 RepID=UPI0027242CD8|nr:YCF48-related protein [Rhodoferax sp.]MDO9195386.1 YCF48-related protein [Rhodoferax sp.]
MSNALKALAIGTVLTVQAVDAAPTGDALDRAAVTVRSPERAVLLSAAQAGARTVAVGERGIVVLSNDNGKNWQQAATPTSVTLTTVRFADASHGWAVGHGAVVLATEDGGNTWVRRLDGRRVAQIALEAARASSDARAIQGAERLQADGPDKPLLDLLVIDARRLLAVGAFGIALGSEDGGKTWASWMPRLPNPKGLHIYTARLRGKTILLAGEQGLVMQSNDSGLSFHSIETPYKGSFFTAELPGDQVIVLAGLRGTVLRSVDSGANWSPLTTPMPVSITSSAMAGDGRLLVTNQAGFVMALQGDHMQPIHAAPLPPLNALLPKPGGAVLALTVQGARQLPTEPGPAK